MATPNLSSFEPPDEPHNSAGPGDVDIVAIRARRAAVHGFEHKRFPDAQFQQEGLAELGPDGHWLTWDMRIPLSREACDFIAHAPADIDALLTALTAARSEAAIAQEHVATLHERCAELEAECARLQVANAKLRDWLKPFAADWDDPTMDVYNEPDADAPDGERR